MASADSAPCSRSAQSKRHCSSYCFDLIDHLSYLSWFVYADAFSCLPPTSLRLGGDVGGFKMEHGICFVTPIKRRNGGMSSGGRKSRVDRKRGGRGRWGGRLKQMKDDGDFLWWWWWWFVISLWWWRMVSLLWWWGWMCVTRSVTLWEVCDDVDDDFLSWWWPRYGDGGDEFVTRLKTRLETISVHETETNDQW